MTYSPDGKTLATASPESMVHIWDADTGALLKTLTGHTKPVSKAAYSPDGKTLATVSRDGTVLLWDISDL